VTDPEPLPPELDELLSAARPLDAAPKEARERLPRRIALSVAAPIAASAAAAAVVHATSPTATTTATTAHGLLSPIAQKILIGVASFAIGGGVGAATQAALTPPPVPAIVQTAAPASRPPAPTPTGAAPAPADIPTVSVNDLPSAPSAAVPVPASPWSPASSGRSSEAS
jgi:hypothetical protein